MGRFQNFSSPYSTPQTPLRQILCILYRYQGQFSRNATKGDAAPSVWRDVGQHANWSAVRESTRHASQSWKRPGQQALYVNFFYRGQENENTPARRAIICRPFCVARYQPNFELVCCYKYMILGSCRAVPGPLFTVTRKKPRACWYTSAGVTHTLIYYIHYRHH